MIRFISPNFDNKMAQAILEAYTRVDSQSFIVSGNSVLPHQIDEQINNRECALYIAWKFDYCVLLEMIRKEQDDSLYTQDFDVIVSCDNTDQGEGACNRWLDAVSVQAALLAREKIQHHGESRLISHAEIHAIYANAVVSFSGSEVNKDELSSNRDHVVTWVNQHLPQCVVTPSGRVH